MPLSCPFSYIIIFSIVKIDQIHIQFWNDISHIHSGWILNTFFYCLLTIISVRSSPILNSLSWIIFEGRNLPSSVFIKTCPAFTEFLPVWESMSFEDNLTWYEISFLYRFANIVPVSPNVWWKLFPIFYVSSFLYLVNMLLFALKIW